MITLKSFIRATLIDEIRNIQQTNKHHYLSFGLISQGIEFLGCCLDGKAYFKDGLSGKRFRNAIDKLFPDEYKKFNIEKGKYDLFENLRCGLLHVCLPKPDIELIQRNEIKKCGRHLEVKMIRGRDALILVSEELFNDFKNACEEIIKRIEGGIIENKNLIATEL